MKLTNVFTHHVHFWLKDKADTAKLFEGLNSLAAIKGVKQIHIGVPADTHGGAVDDSFDASLWTILMTWPATTLIKLTLYIKSFWKKLPVRFVRKWWCMIVLMLN